MKVFSPLRESFDYNLYGYPIWYIKRKRFEWTLLITSSVIGLLIIFTPLGFSSTIKMILWLVPFSMEILAIIMGFMRYRLLKDLENDPLRCDCGGHYVDPDELGFVSDGYYLICDNDDVGDGWACEKKIVNPSIESQQRRDG